MATLKVKKSNPPKHRSPSADARAIRAQYYGTRKWRNIRKAKLMESPLCELCEAEGLTVPAEHVHHVISPFQNDITLFWDYNNLQSICSYCHGKHHVQPQRGTKK